MPARGQVLFRECATAHCLEILIGKQVFLGQLQLVHVFHVLLEAAPLSEHPLAFWTRPSLANLNMHFSHVATNTCVGSEPFSALETLTAVIGVSHPTYSFL